MTGRVQVVPAVADRGSPSTGHREAAETPPDAFAALLAALGGVVVPPPLLPVDGPGVAGGPTGQTPVDAALALAAPGAAPPSPVPPSAALPSPAPSLPVEPGVGRTADPCAPATGASPAGAPAGTLPAPGAAVAVPPPGPAGTPARVTELPSGDPAAPPPAAAAATSQAAAADEVTAAPRASTALDSFDAVTDPLARGSSPSYAPGAPASLPSGPSAAPPPATASQAGGGSGGPPAPTTPTTTPTPTTAAPDGGVVPLPGREPGVAGPAAAERPRQDGSAVEGGATTVESAPGAATSAASPSAATGVATLLGSTAPGNAGAAQQLRPALSELARGLREEGGRASLLIRLDPPELGPVLVRLTVVDGRVDVTLRAPEAAAAVGLSAAAAEVQRVLAENGLDLSSFDVAHGELPGSAARSPDERPSERRASPEGGTKGSGRPAETTPDATGVRVTDDAAPTGASPVATWL